MSRSAAATPVTPTPAVTCPRYARTTCHSFAFALAAATGSDVYELQRRLGQHSQRYIDRYTNPPEDIAAGYIEAL